MKFKIRADTSAFQKYPRTSNKLKEHIQLYPFEQCCNLSHDRECVVINVFLSFNIWWRVIVDGVFHEGLQGCTYMRNCMSKLSTYMCYSTLPYILVCPCICTCSSLFCNCLKYLFLLFSQIFARNRLHRHNPWHQIK